MTKPPTSATKPLLKTKSGNRTVRSKPSPVSSPIATGYTGGLTSADQFNILLFHAAYAENEWRQTSTLSSQHSSSEEGLVLDNDTTKTVHILSPKITISDFPITFPSRFKPGQLYQVVVDRISFFVMDGNARLWPNDLARQGHLR